jgi:anti-anti-sigma regulatory factor
MNTSAAASVAGQNLIRLAAITSIRNCVALKAALLPLLRAPDPIVIDVTAVEHVDTAALQLLFAFCRDRHSLGLTLQWQGESPAWRSGIAILDPNAGTRSVLSSI